MRGLGLMPVEANQGCTPHKNIAQRLTIVKPRHVIERH